MRQLVIVALLLVFLAAPAFSQINWTRHTIDGSFDGGSEVYATDIDGDGDVDIFGAGLHANDIAWWENDGNQNFTKFIIDSDYADARSVYAKDMDNDGDVDILGAASMDSSITIWENDGNENFTENIVTNEYDDAWHVYPIDLDGDNDIDILTASSRGWVTWWENDGSQNFTQHDIDTDFSSARVVYGIDMDGDGDNDVLGAAFYADEIAWWENNGSQSFSKHTIDAAFDGAIEVFATDVDNDGDIDVLGTAYLGGDVTWWENNGSEVFTKHNIDTNFPSARGVHGVDIDGDGDMDVIATGSGGGNGPVKWWENDGNQNFTIRTIEESIAGPTWLYPIDIDNDGDIDIAGTCGYSGDAVYWWENDQDPITGISMIPGNPPIVVRAGGNFRFTGILTNNTNQSQVVDVWIKIRTPDGLLYGPIERFNNLPVNPNQTLLALNARQNIPGFAPYGSYDYIAYCGDYPWTVAHQANFRFGVVPSSMASDSDGWALENAWICENAIADNPSKSALISAFPNPFNAQTAITFELPIASEVKLDVYNTLGQKATTLFEGYREAGAHTVNWDASGYSSGIYFYRLTVGNENLVKRLTLLK